MAKVTAYQVFVREIMPQIKEDHSIQPRDRISSVGSMWKALSDEAKDQWRERAARETLNAQTTYENDKNNRHEEEESDDDDESDGNEEDENEEDTSSLRSQT